MTTPTPTPEREPMQPLYTFDGMDLRLAEVELMIDDELYVLSADVLMIFQEVIHRYETEREYKAEIYAFVETDRATTAATIAKLEAELSASRAREDELRAELTRVLEVAIARGEQLDYSDDDYRARYLELTGRDYDTEDTDGQ